MPTETVKKAKAPARAKSVVAGETEGAVKAAPKVAEKKTTKAAAKPKVIEVVATSAPSHDEIAQLASRYWAERGWQDGYAEQDWLRAERELAGAAS